MSERESPEDYQFKVTRGFYGTYGRPIVRGTVQPPTALEPIRREFRCSFGWMEFDRHFCFWVPWRHASRPLIYRWWSKRSGKWERII